MIILIHPLRFSRSKPFHNWDVNYSEQLSNTNEKRSHCYDDDSICENDTINELERTAIWCYYYGYNVLITKNGPKTAVLDGNCWK